MSGTTEAIVRRAVVCALAAMPGATATAGIVYVRADAAPGGDGSTWQTAFDDIQEALLAADPGDEIWVAAATYRPAEPGGPRSASFTLRTGVAVYGGFDGSETQRSQRDPEANVTVLSGDIAADDGPDFANTAENCYHVVIGSDVDGTAVLDGFTVTGGNADGSGNADRGAGIFVADGNPKLGNCRIVNNIAAWAGGGLVLEAFSNSFVEGCLFAGNRALVGGGGLVISGSRPVFSDCQFEGNSAVDHGGAAYLRDQCLAFFLGCTFDSNACSEIPGQGGGAVVISASSPSFSGCQFTGNSALLGDGGAVFVTLGLSKVPGPGKPSLVGCVFDANGAGRGGAIYAGEQTLASLSECTLTGGSADLGGGLFSDGSGPMLTDCLLEYNMASVAGGAVYARDPSSPVLSGCTLTENTAPEGGAVYCTAAASPSLDGCVLSGNGATRGGALYNSGATPALNGCSVLGSNAEAEGGAIYNVQGSSVMTDCTFTGNEATFGGVLFSTGAGASAVFEQCTLSTNHAVNGGSGICNEMSSLLDLRGCTVRDNTGNATMAGSALLSIGGLAEVTSCTFTGNQAGSTGAAISVVSSGSQITLTNALLAGNGAGPAIALVGPSGPNSVAVTNCTITMPGGQAALAGDAGQIAVTNSIIWNSSIGPASGLTIDYSDVQGGFPGEGNIDLDPRFVDAAAGDYRLLPDSPCIDFGNNGAVPTEVTTDLAGKPRFVDDPEAPDGGKGSGPLVDMGAYEYQSLSSCPADLDTNGSVGVTDLILLIGAWGTAGGDLDGNGTTNVADLLLLLGAWGACA